MELTRRFRAAGPPCAHSSIQRSSSAAAAPSPPAKLLSRLRRRDPAPTVPGTSRLRVTSLPCGGSAVNGLVAALAETLPPVAA
jgi:hypothetical protein